MSDNTTDDSQNQPTDADPAAQAEGEVPQGMGGLDVNSLVGMMSEGGLQDALMQEAFASPGGGGYSIAALVADVINVMRLDAKQMCRLHGIDIEVNEMSEAHAAELLEGMVLQQHTRLLDVFTAIEDHNDKVFKEELGPEQHQRYMDLKTRMLKTVPDQEYDPEAHDG